MIAGRSIARRAFLRGTLLLPTGVLIAACAGPVGTAALTAAPTPAPPPSPTQAASGQALAPTPACGDDDDATPRQTEGPYFTPRSPERASLVEPGMAGTKLVLTGRVVSTRCQSIGRAFVDVWQADDRGAYDNTGYRLRGHVFTDASGQYRIETILPGLYPGRTRHIHVKVQAPNKPVLTSQLYFPNEPGNARDSIFHPRLVVALRDDTTLGKVATFDFVLNVG